MEKNAKDYNRKSIRFMGYDYTLAGAYFVTIISFRRVCNFGEIEKGEVNYSKIGQVIFDCWQNIPEKFSYVKLDEFTLMPNHLHGILWLLEHRGKGEAFSAVTDIRRQSKSENASPLRPKGTRSRSLSAVMQNYKSVSTRMVNRKFFKPGNKIWQRNFHDRIIRNNRELNAIRQYIIDNPLNWEMDKDNPANL